MVYPLKYCLQITYKINFDLDLQSNDAHFENSCSYVIDYSTWVSIIGLNIYATKVRQIAKLSNICHFRT